MVSGIEGVGEAVTGGMLARSVEPEAGEATGEVHGTHCLNCGAELTGHFCSQCGQNSHVHRTLRGFGHDLLHSVFHFEGKIWRTLPMLAWRPGELTRRYIAGERARFVSPVALFLFSVFLMFATFSWVGGPMNFGGSDQTPAEVRSEALRDFQREQAEHQSDLARLRTERERLVRAGQPTAEVDGDIRNIEQDAQTEARVFNQAMTLVGAEERAATRVGDEAEQAEALEQVTGGNMWLGEAWRHAKENPELVAYKLQSNAYKFSWALIPISVPFVWLLFLHRRRHRRYNAYDHTVFVTYSITFMSLGLIVLSLLRLIGAPEGLLGLALLLVPPYHIYRQLRGAYELSRFSAIWRTFLLIMFAFTAGGLFFMLLAALASSH